jgi:hypothetical protein
VPADVIRAKCAPYLHGGKPARRPERTVDTDFSIVAQFQSEFGESRRTTGWGSTATSSDSSSTS